MKSKKSKFKVRYKCPDCGSTVQREMVEGTVQEYCTNDLLPEYSKYFQWFIKQSEALQAELMSTWDEHKSNMFSSWFIARKDELPFECLFKVDPRAKLFMPSKCNVTIPDTAQVMIAEWILKRPLSEKELTGAWSIPTITEEGLLSEDRINTIVFPKDVNVQYKDMFDKTMYELMPVLFNKDEL